MSLVLIVVLLLLVGGAFHGHGQWGYWPGGTLGIVLIVVLILALSGRL